MHQLAHALGHAGAGDFFWQRAVHTVKGCGRAVQDSHQIDHRVHALHGLGECGFIMHITFQHGERGQMQDIAGIHRAPSGHGDAQACANQLFTHMGANKAGAAKNQYVFHIFDCRCE